MITGVVVSSGQHLRLQHSLRSFFDARSGPLQRLIVLHDGRGTSAELHHEFQRHPIMWICTEEEVGRLAAIDYVYSRVQTPYIFHFDDEWVFFRSGFLERSLAVLQANPKCLQVQIQSVHALGRALSQDLYSGWDAEWRQFAFDRRTEQQALSFSFEPGLRRLSDYVAVGGYGIHGLGTDGTTAEESIGTIYRRRDFFGAVLTDHHGLGYVRRQS